MSEAASSAAVCSTSSSGLAGSAVSAIQVVSVMPALAGSSPASPHALSELPVRTGSMTPTMAESGLRLRSSLDNLPQTFGAKDISSFNKSTHDLQGYSAGCLLNLKSNIRRKEKALGSTHDFQHFELGRSDVRIGDPYIALGTDSPESVQHFLSIIDGDIMRKSAREDPVLCYARVSEHLSDVRWLNADTLLAATGKGHLKLFRFDKGAETVKHIGDLNNACASYIREVAVQANTVNHVALGGFDQKLNFLDLNRPDTPYMQRLDMQSAIGSVKWKPFQNGSLVSCGLDNGKFYLFDAREKVTSATFYIDTRTEDLFTHERYNDCMVLLGYGDGQIKHIDMRQAHTVLSTVQDPFVEAIGGIEFNAEAEAFVVSGYTDFTEWKVKCTEAAVHKHSENSSRPLRGMGYACSAVFYDSQTLLSSDNEGAVRLFCQD